MAVDLSGGDFDFLLSQLQQGNVVLFCGAGFSYDARNTLGNHLPLGRELSEELAAMASFPYRGEPLPVVYRALQMRVGSSTLNDKLRGLYEVNSFDAWYSIVTEIIWHRIYTTNIDNLLNRIYAGKTPQRILPILCPSPPHERDPHFTPVEAVYLHGSVSDLDKGVTFTFDDFAGQLVEINPWYQKLIDDLFFRPILFIGTLLEESPFHHYVALRGSRPRTIRETRPKSYLIDPGLGPIRIESLREENIIGIPCTGREFFEALKARVAPLDISLDSVRRHAFPYIFATAAVTNPNSVVRFFDPIFPATLPPSDRRLAHNFYLGAEPTWQDIQEERDGRLEIADTIHDVLTKHNDKFQCVVIYGPAGCGKTTLTKRVAYDLASSGQAVYFGKDDQTIDFDGLLNLVNDPDFRANRIFVFIDNMARQLSGIHRAVTRLASSDRLTLILAEQKNTYTIRAHALSSLAPTEILAPDLTERDARSIISRLEHFNFLGALLSKSPEERIQEFMQRASRQLLVAMKETTSGRGFTEILRSEYNDLPSDAKLAYTICSLAVAQGAPGVYRKHLLPSLGKTTSVKSTIITELLNGVLVSSSTSDTLLRPRHRVIAFEIAKEIAPMGIKYEAVLALLKQLAAGIVPNDIKRKSPAYLAYRGLINSDGLYTLFGGDRDTILSLYQELEPYYRHQYLFWLHYAMAYIAQGDLCPFRQTHLRSGRVSRQAWAFSPQEPSDGEASARSGEGIVLA